MKRWHITVAAVALLLGIGYIMEDSQNWETWAVLFWISAIGNVVLFMLWYDAKERAK
jgi:hypothetical protein